MKFRPERDFRGSPGRASGAPPAQRSRRLVQVEQSSSRRTTPLPLFEQPDPGAPIIGGAEQQARIMGQPDGGANRPADRSLFSRFDHWLAVTRHDPAAKPPGSLNGGVVMT